MVYLHHINNFRERTEPIDTTRTNTGTGDTRTRSTTETKEGIGGNNIGLFTSSGRTKRVSTTRKEDGRLFIGKELLDLSDDQ